MKHASPRTLAQAPELLQALRALPGITERTPGSFYCRSKAYLHFHEDAAGLFADVKLNGQSFDRLPANTAAERSRLVELILASLAQGRSARQ